MSRRGYAVVAALFAAPVPWFLSWHTDKGYVASGAFVFAAVMIAIWAVAPADEHW